MISVVAETSENIEYLSRRSRQSQSVEASMVPKSNSSEFSPMSKRDDVLYDRIEDSTSRTAQNPVRSSVRFSLIDSRLFCSMFSVPRNCLYQNRINSSLQSVHPMEICLNGVAH